MLPILNIGPLAMQTPGLILLAGLWLGLSLSERRSERFGVPATALYNLVFAALVAGLLGARLAYVARYPQAFAANPLDLVSLNPALLDAWGGAAIGGLAALIYGNRNQLSFWATLDALTPALAVLGVAAGLSHLASGDALGAPSQLPWAIALWGERRHPSQAYETLAALAILAAVWRWASAPPRPDARPGTLFLAFLALSASARLFLEAFRGDSTLIFGAIRQAQVLAWLALALSLALLDRRQRPAPATAAQLEEA